MRLQHKGAFLGGVRASQQPPPFAEGSQQLNQCLHCEGVCCATSGKVARHSNLKIKTSPVKEMARC